MFPLHPHSEAWDSDVSLDVQHLLRELEEKQSETVEVTDW